MFPVWGATEEGLRKADELGINVTTIDAKDEFTGEWLTKAIRANSDYNGYPVSTSMTRQLVARIVALEGLKQGCDCLVEGSTGKGNDQYRMHNVFKMFAPELKILVPVRDFDLTRSVEEARAQLAEAPYILKSPEWGLVLKGFVQAGAVEVDHVYIPVRDLDEAARSRLDVNLEWQVCPEDDYDYRLMDQTSVLGLALGFALEACLMCDIPYTLMLFPRLVEDGDYCREKLAEGLPIDPAKFEGIFAELARPEQVVWRHGRKGENGRNNS